MTGIAVQQPTDQSDSRQNGIYVRYIKRTLDVTTASVLVIILAIPFVFIAIWIKLDSRGPVLFNQKRAGRNLRPFMVYKFRTMTTNAPQNRPTNSFGNAGAYITRAGKIMRKLSIDELPQIFNVIKNDMSIVGPRPVILMETDLLRERQQYGANACKPGITGWAQVNGRDELVTSVKAKMDGEYANKVSFAMDAKCLKMTIGAVLSIKGNKDGHELVNNKPIQRQPKIVLTPQTVFYAKVSSRAGKSNKRSVIRRGMNRRNEQKLYEI